MKIYMQSFRKIALTVATLLVSVTALSLMACSDYRYETPDTEYSINTEEMAIEEEPPASQVIPVKTKEEEVDVQSIKTLFTVEESREIAQAWLDENPVEEPNLLDIDNFEKITHENVDYYRFFHIEPDMYWFSILVKIETGELYVMIVEDGMEPETPFVEPLDVWYSWDSIIGCDDGPGFMNAVMSNCRWIDIFIYWEDGRETKFTRNPDRDWVMNSRDGGTSIVYPEFSVDGRTIEIRFPTTTRVYYLYEDKTGVFGNEHFTWGSDARDEDQ